MVTPTVQDSSPVPAAVLNTILPQLFKTINDKTSSWLALDDLIFVVLPVAASNQVIVSRTGRVVKTNNGTGTGFDEEIWVTRNIDVLRARGLCLVNCCVIWSGCHTGRFVTPLVHAVFDISWIRLAQSSPSTVTADYQCTVDIDKFEHKTIESSLNPCPEMYPFRYTTISNQAYHSSTSTEGKNNVTEFSCVGMQPGRQYITSDDHLMARNVYPASSPIHARGVTGYTVFDPYCSSFHGHMSAMRRENIEVITYPTWCPLETVRHIASHRVQEFTYRPREGSATIALCSVPHLDGCIKSIIHNVRRHRIPSSPQLRNGSENEVPSSPTSRFCTTCYHLHVVPAQLHRRPTLI
ncbi:hypothetical protein PR048_023242 [Dryococelus australis]|uniref:Uncharacterized protein n=1 Tax=Dryococelus australis TaxID=614101 RepID=A0ABQ9GTJ5_9NEOP|nr:hypothetical protein PR048_023242 [Dryococelus australis]